MSECVTISSENFSGYETNVVYMPSTGGTITLGLQTFPFTYESDYVFGIYYCYIPRIDYTYTVNVPGPTPTPTVTPTITPTPLPTPTPSPALVYSTGLWTDTVWNDACQAAGEGPAQVIIYTLVPYGSLSIGDYVYGNSSLTIPPIGSDIILTNGVTFIQIDLITGIIVDVGSCP